MLFKLAISYFVVLFEFSKLPHAFAFESCGNVPSRKAPYLRILTKKRPIKIKKGEDLALYCEAGVTGRKLTWHKRTAGIDKAIDLSLRNGGDDHIVDDVFSTNRKSVRIKDVKKSDSGTYVCKMHGSIPGKIILETCVDVIVLAKIQPNLSIKPRNRPIKIKEGEHLAIECKTWEVTGQWKMLQRKLKWYKRTSGTDKVLPNLSSGSMAAAGISYGFRSFHFEGVTKNDSGKYVCKRFGSILGKPILERSVDIVVLDKSSNVTELEKRRDDDVDDD